MTVRRIKTTIPGRTLGSKASKPKLHSLYLRMSHLAMERLRRNTEIANLQARLELLTKRVETIDVELAKLRELAALGSPPIDEDSSLGASKSDVSGHGLSIQY